MTWDAINALVHIGLVVGLSVMGALYGYFASNARQVQELVFCSAAAVWCILGVVANTIALRPGPSAIKEEEDE